MLYVGLNRQESGDMGARLQEALVYYGQTFKDVLAATYADIDLNKQEPPDGSRAWKLAVANEAAAYLASLRRDGVPEPPLIMRMPLPDFSGPNGIYCVRRYRETHPAYARTYGDALTFTRGEGRGGKAITVQARVGQVLELQNGTHAVVVDVTTKRTKPFHIMTQRAYHIALTNPRNPPQFHVVRAEAVRDAQNSKKRLLEDATLEELRTELKRRSTSQNVYASGR